MSPHTYRQDDPTLERWLHALAGIGEAVGGDEPIAQLLDRVARTACTLLGYDFCAVFLPDEARAALTIVGSHGMSGDYIAQVNADRPILLDVHGEQEAPTSIAFRTCGVVTLEDIDLVPEFGWAVLIDEVHGGDLSPTVTPIDDHWESGVVLDGAVVTRIQVAGETALSALDVRAVEHAAVVTALELLRASTAAEVEQRLRGSLIADLMTSDFSDAAATSSLFDRARHLGWDLSGSRTLITTRWPEPERAERVLAITDRFAADIAPRPLAALFRGDLVLVWSSESHCAAADLARRLVGALSSGGAVEFAVAAVSATGTVGDLPDAYRTLCGAMNLAADAQTTTVIDMADVTIDHLLLQLDDPQRLRAFARSVLGPVLDYDRTRQTELIHTARIHLEHSLDRRATASALHLHPNTVSSGSNGWKSWRGFS